MKPNLYTPSRSRRAITILLVLIGVTVCIIWFWVWNDSRRLSFQAYMPTVLQPGVTVTGHQTSVTTGEGEHYKAVNITTSLTKFTIGEEKVDHRYSMINYACDSRISNAICVSKHSPNGTRYDVQMIIIDGEQQPFSEHITWIFDDTRFWISLDKSLTGKYTDDSWGKIIDGFQPVPYGHETGKQLRIQGG